MDLIVSVPEFPYLLYLVTLYIHYLFNILHCIVAVYLKMGYFKNLLSC